MSTPTKRDVISAAMSIADDTAQGRLDLAALQDQAMAELRELFGSVAGLDDPLWDLHLEIARQVLALDGIPADELSEWRSATRSHSPSAAADP